MSFAMNGARRLFADSYFWAIDCGKLMICSKGVSIPSPPGIVRRSGFLVLDRLDVISHRSKETVFDVSSLASID